MKRFLTLFAGAFLLIMTGCDTAERVGPESNETSPIAFKYASIDWDTDGTDGQVDLIAGQHTKVGVVDVSDDGTNLYVSYSLDGWCMTEAHVAVDVDAPADGFGDVTNPQGKAVPGLFPYPDSNSEALEGCESDYTVVIPLADIDGYSEGGDLFLAVHAVVAPLGDAVVTEDCNCIYGIAKDGNIYTIKIDPDNPAVGDVAQAFTTTLDNPPANSNWPNGLANDQANGRLYFTNYDGTNNPLYFINTSDGTQTTAGELDQRNADAVFAGGGYWYVTQNERDNLRLATFNGDGTIATDVVECTDFIDDGLGETPMEFGDLAFDPVSGLLYGNARIGEFASGNSGPDDETATFFSLDPTSCDYTVISEDNLFLQQLTFDCADNLLGQNTSTGTFLLIDVATGEQTEIGNTTQQFNDLAVGNCDCEPEIGEDETAWGAGEFFPTTRGPAGWGDGLFFQYQ